MKANARKSAVRFVLWVVAASGAGWATFAVCRWHAEAISRGDFSVNGVFPGCLLPVIIPFIFFVTIIGAAITFCLFIVALFAASSEWYLSSH